MTDLIRSASLTHYAEIARYVGIDPKAMLKQARLPLHCLDSPDLRVAVGGQDFHLAAPGARMGDMLSFSLRPEILRPVAPGDAAPAGWVTITARLEHVEFLGALTRMDMSLGDGTRLRVAALDLPSGWVRQSGTVALAYAPARVTAFRAR